MAFDPLAKVLMIVAEFRRCPSPLIHSQTQDFGDWYCDCEYILSLMRTGRG